MEQRKGVHQLECSTGADHHRVIGVTPGADKSPVRERRAQSLATGEDKSGDLADRIAEIGVEGGPTLCFSVEQSPETVLDVTANGGQRRRRNRARHDAAG